RPEVASSPALLDARVRRGLAYAIDKDATNSAAWAGLAIPSDIWIGPTTEVGRAVDAAIAKYPFDLRLSDQQLSAAGYTRSAAGVYTGPNGSHMALDIMTNT